MTSSDEKGRQAIRRFLEHPKRLTGPFEPEPEPEIITHPDWWKGALAELKDTLNENGEQP